MASQFNVVAERRVIREDEDDHQDWLTDNDDDSYSQPATSAMEVLEGSETAQLSHAGGEFYELVRDEIRKLHK